jgi:hypothetical protein
MLGTFLEVSKKIHENNVKTFLKVFRKTLNNMLIFKVWYPQY